MLYTPDQSLKKRRTEIAFGLMRFNQTFGKKYEDICHLRGFILERVGEELFNIGFNKIENSSVYEDVLEHIKELTDRFCRDIRSCFNNFREDAKWLTDNINEFDVFHSYMWCKMMEQVNGYPQLLDTLFWRFMKVYKMLYDAIEILNRILTEEN